LEVYLIVFYMYGVIGIEGMR